MKTAFVYTDTLAGYDYGSAHPLKTARLTLTRELIVACGLLTANDPRLVEPFMATEEDLLAFHTGDYLEALKVANSGRHFPGAAHFGLGPGDNPVFRGLLDGSRLGAGASLLAAALVDSGQVSIAFNIGGGLHHALAARASGFCYVNDPVLAILSLVNKGRRVAYIDIDAHHGDGVQEAFYATDRVLTISIHETGAALFPGTGFEYETGTGSGKGYCANIPLPPESDDELFLRAFDGTVPFLIEAFKPDIIVTQLGVDTFRSDPLAHLNCTTNGFCEAVAKIRDLAPRWVALGGGGYDIANVARAWTLAWAIMNDAEAPVEIPREFLEKHGREGFAGKLRDAGYIIEGQRKERMEKEVDRVIEYIKNEVLKTMGSS